MRLAIATWTLAFVALAGAASAEHGCGYAGAGLPPLTSTYGRVCALVSYEGSATDGTTTWTWSSDDLLTASVGHQTGTDGFGVGLGTWGGVGQFQNMATSPDWSYEGSGTSAYAGAIVSVRYRGYELASANPWLNAYQYENALTPPGGTTFHYRDTGLAGGAAVATYYGPAYWLTAGIHQTAGEGYCYDAAYAYGELAAGSVGKYVPLGPCLAEAPALPPVGGLVDV